MLLLRWLLRLLLLLSWLLLLRWLLLFRWLLKWLLLLLLLLVVELDVVSLDAPHDEPLLVEPHVQARRDVQLAERSLAVLAIHVPHLQKK